MASSNVVPFRPYESVAKQLRRLGRCDLQREYFRLVHQEIDAGRAGSAVAGCLLHFKHIPPPPPPSAPPTGAAA